MLKDNRHLSPAVQAQPENRECPHRRASTSPAPTVVPLSCSVSLPLELAEELYETILEIDPNHAQANHCMGLLKTDMGNDKEALPYLENAIIADGSILRFWGSLIKTLNRLGDLEEAKKIIGLARNYGANDEEIKTLEIELHQ